MSNQVQPFPWKQLMRFGFGVLKLPPDAFWSLTLPELEAAIEVHFPATRQPVTRNWLEKAMQDHPDVPPSHNRNSQP